MLLNKLINESIKQELMNDDLINKDMTTVRTPIILKHNAKRNQYHLHSCNSVPLMPRNVPQPVK
jgi:hypothetical protein